MAYNVVKGNVEGSVDQHGDQEVNGRKTFCDLVSAPAFYNTTLDAPMASLSDIAIKEVIGTRQHSVLTKGPTGTAIATRDVRVEGGTLLAKKICCENIEGSAYLMSNIPANRFADKIASQHLQLGASFQDKPGALRIKAGPGIVANSDGVAVNGAPNGGLSHINNKLVISPVDSLSVQIAGQNLQDDDLLLIQDVSRGDLRNTTLANLYDSYINAKIPQAEGSLGALQLKGNKGLAASPNLLYDEPANTLRVKGSLTAIDIEAASSITATNLCVKGAVFKNINTVNSTTYEVAPNDYTVLADTTKNKVKIILPDAADHPGRVIVVKKINAQKYKINSNVAEIETDGGNIDIFDSVTLKMNSASKMLQSDGLNWLTIGSTAS